MDFFWRFEGFGISPANSPAAARRLKSAIAKKKGYQTSQRIRKRIEEIFGWMKTTGGIRKTRYRGVERTHFCGQMVVATYNLLRLAKLNLEAMMAAPPPPEVGA